MKNLVLETTAPFQGLPELVADDARPCLPLGVKLTWSAEKRTWGVGWAGNRTETPPRMAPRMAPTCPISGEGVACGEYPRTPCAITISSVGGRFGDEKAGS